MNKYEAEIQGKSLELLLNSIELAKIVSEKSILRRRLIQSKTRVRTVSGVGTIAVEEIEHSKYIRAYANLERLADQGRSEEFLCSLNNYFIIRDNCYLSSIREILVSDYLDASSNFHSDITKDLFLKDEELDEKYSKLGKIRTYRFRALGTGAGALIASSLTNVNNPNFSSAGLSMAAFLFIFSGGISLYLEYLKGKDGKIKFNESYFHEIRSRMDDDYLKNLLNSNQDIIKNKLNSA